MSVTSVFPLTDFPDFGASRDGRIWRIRYSKYSEKRKTLPFELSQTRVKNGYLAVWLCCNGGKTIRIVHRLIAETFLPPKPSAKHQVAHADGNRLNNAVSNLRWATALENAADKRQHGTLLRGAQIGTAKLTDGLALKIRESKESAPTIAKSLGVSIKCVYRVRRMETWAHV